MAKRNSKKKLSKKNNNSKKTIIISIIVIVLLIIAFFSFKLGFVKVTKQGFAAKVNDETISYETLEEQYILFFTLAGYPEQYRSIITKEKYLDQLVVESLLLQEAEKEGITIDNVEKEDLKDMIDNYLEQLAYSETDLIKKLVENGLTVDDLTEYFKKQIVIMNFLDTTLLEDIKVSSESVEEYYRNNKEDFIAGEGQIRARHILVDTEEEAEEILKLLSKGQLFSVLAKERSKDPSSAVRGGDLGFFKKDEMIKEFSDAAFDLEEAGDLSDVVQTQFGYHIIQREDDVVDFEEAKEDIELMLLSEKQKTELQDYLNELKSKSTIIYDE